MWNNYYLKFPDEATANAALQDTLLSAIDVLGDLSTPEWTDDEGIKHPAHSVSGWHVNVRNEGTLPDGLKQYSISEPQEPKRIFFGS